LRKGSDIISINICTIVEESNISCKFRENDFRIYRSSIFVSMILIELTLIYDINLTILNDIIALKVDCSSSTIPKNIVAEARVIALCNVIYESRVRNSQIMRIVDKNCPACDSPAIFKNRFANQIFPIFIRTLFGDLSLLNKYGTSLSALDVFEL